MRRLAPLLLALSLAVPGCGSPTQVLTEVTLGEPFDLEVGNVAVLRDQQLSIRFLSVLEDSRCPTDSLILCIWAGRVRLRLAVAPLSGDEAFVELHFGDDPTAVTLGTLRLELLDVLPPARTETIPPGDYTAQLVLTAVR